MSEDAENVLLQQRFWNWLGLTEKKLYYSVDMKTENGYLKILAKMHEKREREKKSVRFFLYWLCV